MILYLPIFIQRRVVESDFLKFFLKELEEGNIKRFGSKQFFHTF
ncbi:hypothetical protein LEP1GSC008_2699 [Leptospira kirschneri serovar Bulgarica str. Nikolaevo]|uniref:Uncharacterized protein n=1 Tax=Leptospira kirschneri serovar Bulgarica str. Nikolaevo TaxID=1240687 RepID=M6FP86_9LEPT|nr:hypothetical protein LEP1GSC008_2699 [Leptospira kirschneri serovar Bulgarica str. Nikolaevo]